MCPRGRSQHVSAVALHLVLFRGRLGKRYLWGRRGCFRRRGAQVFRMIGHGTHVGQRPRPLLTFAAPALSIFTSSFVFFLNATNASFDSSYCAWSDVASASWSSSICEGTLQGCDQEGTHGAWLDSPWIAPA